MSAEILPPSWVPSFPASPRAPELAPRAGAARRSPSARTRRLIVGTLLGALAAVCVALAQEGRLTLGGLLADRTPALLEAETSAVSSPADAQALPTLDPLSRDEAGSTILDTSYRSAAIDSEGSFYVYLPAGYDATTAHYPVVYMLTGTDQSAEAFLRVGVQQQLDRLIARHAIPPTIAVMVQGGPGSNLWRNAHGLGYESYVLEVQETIDRMLPTLPTRDERAIVGDSMGGYGAMHTALANPYRFGVVESWIGFFNGLGPTLRRDRPVIARLGLHAFVYGAAEDRIADPREDMPFAAALRAVGADAKGAVYPGEHNLQTVEDNLERMLVFAGRSFAHAGSPRASPRRG